MFLFFKRLLGWIFGTLFALLIALAVRFFERRLRFDTRRDPAWRSQGSPEDSTALPPPQPSSVL